MVHQYFDYKPDFFMVPNTFPGTEKVINKNFKYKQMIYKRNFNNI